MSDTTHPFLGRTRRTAAPGADHWLRSMPREVVVVGLVPVLVVAIVGVAAVMSARNLRSEAGRVVTASTAQSLTASIHEGLASVDVTDATAPDAERPDLAALSDRLRSSFDSLDSLGPNAAAQKARSSTDDALGALMHVEESPKPAAADLSDASRRLELARTDVTALVSEVDRQFVEATEAAERSASGTDRLTILLALLAAGTPLAVIAWFNRRNRREVGDLDDLLAKISDGIMPTSLDRSHGPIHAALHQSFGHAAASISDQLERMQAWALRSDVDLRLGEAFEGVSTRTEMTAAVSQSFTTIDPNLPMELMVTAPDGSRMLRVASSPEAGAPGCPVTGGSGCPAMSTTSTVYMSDTASATACPHMRSRNFRGVAVCVPLTDSKGPAGVIHATARRADDLPPSTVDSLETLADLSASRLSSVRSMEQTMRRATTDQLTGLANRRTFEELALELLRSRTEFILVMADLDHFKRLNDNFGHETGDRVLQVFARVLAENIRRSDLAARYGGEEFLVLLPDTLITDALVTLDRVRLALATTLSINGLPTTTASFGVARSSQAPDLDSLLRVADAGLYQAKADGRDRIIEADAAMVERIFR